MVDLCLQENCMEIANHKKTPHKPAFPNSKCFKGLPKSIINKLNKTLQTRGAQPKERVPYQNRVSRWNRVVIPYSYRDHASNTFDGGYTIMVKPDEYFSDYFDQSLVKIGENAFIYYDNRADWEKWPPLKDWQPSIMINKETGLEAKKVTENVMFKGHYICRIPATTSQGEKGPSIVSGSPQGIRFFEYSSHFESFLTTCQLAYLVWKIFDIQEHVDTSISSHLTLILDKFNLNDDSKLEQIRTINSDGMTCCPLCMEPLTANELMAMVKQAKGREVTDLTITEANLFHLKDLKPGEYNHHRYQLGWGHHYCNMVAQDKGIEKTLDWMKEVLKNQKYY